LSQFKRCEADDIKSPPLQSVVPEVAGKVVILKIRTYAADNPIETLILRDTRVVKLAEETCIIGIGHGPTEGDELFRLEGITQIIPLRSVRSLAVMTMREYEAYTEAWNSRQEK
jgi:hypothetical protein